MSDLKICALDACGKFVQRRTKQGPRKYAAQKYCSPECASKSQRKQESRVCSACGVIFHREPRDQNWRDRKCCSPKCSEVMKHGPLADKSERKTCPGCGVLFGPDKFISAIAWQNKKYHTPSCQSRHYKVLAKDNEAGPVVLSAGSNLWPDGYQYEDDPRLPRVRKYGEPEVPPPVVVDVFRGRPAW